MPVDIKGMSPDEISKKLKPLDIVVYQRHVLIVISRREVIESTIQKGVHIRDMKKAIEDIRRKMVAADD